MDPYINVDPGTMSPIQHGEVFVTDDGAETDLDLGHYERFTKLTLGKKNNFTSGQVYLQVIENEREGKYLGKTVQVVPHITDEIKRRIELACSQADLLLAEIGGTVGDIESLPFLEAIRQFAQDVGEENVLFLHLVLVPYLSAAGELKTKPAQHSVKDLRSIGLFPNIILCRSERPLDEGIMEKISMFCNVPKANVFESLDVSPIYKVPLEFFKQGLDEKVTQLLGIWSSEPKLKDIEQVVYNVEHPKKSVTIAIVGKYTELTESYKSLEEALGHAAIKLQAELIPKYIDAERAFENSAVTELLKDAQGILIPGGFGHRGVKGKLQAIEYARTQQIPFLGICLGLQMAIIEFAQNVLGLTDANSQEFQNDHPNPIIHYMTGQSENLSKGGSMRLGAYNCLISPQTKAYDIYQQKNISERHRHRLEVNNSYLKQLKDAGLVISGVNPELNLVEIIELKDHPFFVATQFHPEFKSRPFDPHPLFIHFLDSSLQIQRRS